MQGCREITVICRIKGFRKLGSFFVAPLMSIVLCWDIFWHSKRTQETLNPLNPKLWLRQALSCTGRTQLKHGRAQRDVPGPANERDMMVLSEYVEILSGY